MMNGNCASFAERGDENTGVQEVPTSFFAFAVYINFYINYCINLLTNLVSTMVFFLILGHVCLVYFGEFTCTVHTVCVSAIAEKVQIFHISFSSG